LGDWVNVDAADMQKDCEEETVRSHWIVIAGRTGE